jgi:recombination protein RecR
LKPAVYPEAILGLIQQLKRLPGIGPRSAERIALWLVQSPDAHPAELGAALAGVAAGIRLCERCGFFSAEPLCGICQDEGRQRRVLCVIEQPTDVLPIERSGAFRGLYHSLGGRIAPLDHIGPEQLRIAPLLERVREECPEEVILALGADVEGEATAHYLAGLLAETGVKITRIAQGVPAGAGLESADELSLNRALAGRREMAQGPTGRIHP